MGKAKGDSSWLEGVDPDWALSYLKERAPSKHVHQQILSAIHFHPNTQNLQYLVSELRQDQTCTDLVSGLRNAIKQKRYRNSHNGNKPRTFLLSDLTSERLRSLARKNNKPENAIIASLIDGTFNDKLSKDEDYITAKRKADLERKIFKRQIASCNTQLKESLAHLENYLRRLAILEHALGDFVPDLSSDAAIDEITKSTSERLRLVKNSLSIIAAEYTSYYSSLTKTKGPFSYVRLSASRTRDW